MSVSAVLTFTSTQTLQDATFTTLTNWGAPLYQDVTVWDAGSPSRITVPAGFSYARITFCIRWGINLGFDTIIGLLKNGGEVNGTVHSAGLSIGGDSKVCETLIPVSEGDFFEVRAFQNSGTTRDINTSSWFAIEFLQLSAA